MHSSLVVTTSGTPLGLSAVKFWTRSKFKGTAALKRLVNQTRVPIETKESYRWLENLRQSIALVGSPERCVRVGERENSFAWRRISGRGFLCAGGTCGSVGRSGAWCHGAPQLQPLGTAVKLA